MTQPPPLPPLPPINPYAAPQARLEDVARDQLELAGRGERLGAAILDNIILVGPMILIIIGVGASVGASGGGDDSFVAVMLLAYLVPVVVGVINLVMLHNSGQTIAKRMLSIKIVRTNGERCSTPRLVFARWLPMALVGFIPLINILMMFLDPLLIFAEDRRCIHDHIADTVVVKC